MLRGGFQQIRDERNALALAGFARLLGLGRGTNRPPRPRIDRRLRQHIIVERDGLALSPLGAAAAPLLGDRIPVGTGLLVERRAGLEIFLQLAAVFRDRLRGSGLRHRAGRCCRKGRGLDSRRLRRDQQQRERNISGMANRMKKHRPVVSSMGGASQPRNLGPLPLGEGWVRGYGLSINLTPSPDLLRKSTSPHGRGTLEFNRAVSLRLDAAGLDELRPFLLILVDEGGIVFRRARRDLGAIQPELL